MCLVEEHQGSFRKSGTVITLSSHKGLLTALNASAVIPYVEEVQVKCRWCACPHLATGLGGVIEQKTEAPPAAINESDHWQWVRAVHIEKQEARRTQDGEQEQSTSNLCSRSHHCCHNDRQHHNYLHQVIASICHLSYHMAECSLNPQPEAYNGSVF